MTAGTTGTAPGIARPSGSTTSELRVAALNEMARAWPAGSRHSRPMPQPMAGASTAYAA